MQLIDSVELKEVCDESIVVLTEGEEEKSTSRKEILPGFRLNEALHTSPHGTIYDTAAENIPKPLVTKFLANLSDAAKQKFTEHAELAKMLDHPHIAPVYAHGIAAEGQAYLVSEKAAGRSLTEVFASGDKLSSQVITSIFIQLCDALDYANKNGVTIGDISSDHIFINGIETGEPSVKLVNVGTQRNSLEQDRSPRSLLSDKSAVQYASPERCVGKPIDERAQVYSIGCLLFQSVYQKPPFDGSDPIKVMFEHVSGDPLVVPQYGSKFEILIRRCMDRNVGERLRDLKSLRTNLEHIANATPKSVPLQAPPTEKEKAARVQMEKQLHLLCVLLLALLLGLQHANQYSANYHAFKRDLVSLQLTEIDFSNQQRWDKWKRLDRIAYSLFLPPSVHGDIQMRMASFAPTTADQRKCYLTAANAYRTDLLPNEELTALENYRWTFVDSWSDEGNEGKPFYYEHYADEKIPPLLREVYLRQRYAPNDAWTYGTKTCLIDAYMTKGYWEPARRMSEAIARVESQSGPFTFWRAAECNYHLSRLKQAEYWYKRAAETRNTEMSAEDSVQIALGLAKVRCELGREGAVGELSFAQRVADATEGHPSEPLISPPPQPVPAVSMDSGF